MRKKIQNIALIAALGVFVNSFTKVSASIVNENYTTIMQKEKNKNNSIENLRLKWKQDLVGDEALDINNKTIESKITGYVNSTDKLLSSLNQNKELNWLWED